MNTDCANTTVRKQRWALPPTVFVSTVVTLGTLFVAITLQWLSFPLFWMAYVIGFGVVLPLSLGMVPSRIESSNGDYQKRAETGEKSAIENLKKQYMDGKLSEAEFEHQLELVLVSE